MVDRLVRDVSHSAEELSAVESKGEIVRGLSTLESFRSEERSLDDGSILVMETSLRTLLPAEKGVLCSPSSAESSSSEVLAIDIRGAVDLSERVRRLSEGRLSERLKRSPLPALDRERLSA